MLKAGATHGGEHREPGSVPGDLDLWHRVVEARQPRLHRPFFSRFWAFCLRLLVLLVLILKNICVFTAFKHVEKVVMKEVEITDIDPGV